MTCEDRLKAPTMHSSILRTCTWEAVLKAIFNTLETKSLKIELLNTLLGLELLLLNWRAETLQFLRSDFYTGFFLRQIPILMIES